MKKLVLLILLTPTLSFSQNEFLPADTATWTGRWVGPLGMQGWMQFFTDTIQGDTTIGSYDYKRLMTKDSGNDYYFAAYRSDTTTKEIFLVDKDSTNEVLFFDFDAGYNVGDTVWIPNYMYGALGFGEYTLLYTNGFGIGSNNYQSYTFGWTGNKVGLPDVGQEIEISERLISSTSFPFFGSGFFETWYELKCYQEPDINYGYCPYYQGIGSSIDEISIEASVYPNPAEDFLMIKVLDNEINTLIIYDQIGRTVIETTFIKEISLDLTDLKTEGLYFYKIESATRLDEGKFIKN